MIKKRLIVPALVALALPLTLTSCNGNSNVESAGEDFEVYSIAKLKERATKDNPVKVEFWHSFGDNISKSLDPLIEQFQEEMEKQDIYITVNAKSIGGGYDGLRSRVNQGTKTNSIPTMILGYPDHFADYISSDILLPLNDYVNYADKSIGFTDDEIKNDFVQTYWAENQLTGKNGKQIIAGIPFNKSTEVMYYNASVIDPLLEEHGWLTEDGEWDTPTWDELWTIAETLKEMVANGTCTWTHMFDGNETTVSAVKSDYPVYIDSEANFFITTARQWAESKDQPVYTTVDANGKGTVVFDNEITREVQAYFLEKAEAGLWNLPKKVNQGYGSNMMNNNEAFISIGSTAGVNNNASSKYKMKVAPIPQKSFDSGVQAVIQQGTNAAILKNNSNNYTRLAAWLLIRFLTSTEVTTTFSRETGYLPVRKSAIESDEFQEFLVDDWEGDIAATAKAILAAYSQQDYYYTDPAFQGSSIVRDVVDLMIQTIYCNGATIDAAMKTAYQSLRDYQINVQEPTTGA